MIESFFDYDIRIENKMLIYVFVANGKDMTELRMIEFLDRMRQIMSSFYDKQVTKACLYFDVEKLKLPSN